MTGIDSDRSLAHQRIATPVDLLVVASFVGVFLALFALMFYKSEDPLALINDVSRWFDPTFFQYNLLLAAFAVLLIPAITVFYLTRMQHEKRRRMEAELPLNEWRAIRPYIDRRIRETFTIRKYLGSMLTFTLVVLFGIGIILLFKPMPLVDGNCVIDTTEGASGVDFCRGANFLMLGPYMQQYVLNDTSYVPKLINSLTAFQFGFAGAYLYFLTHLVRSYFTLDLTPNTFVASSVRLIVGSVVALVVSFMLPGPQGDTSGFGSALPLVSFYIGFFPSRGLMMVQKSADRVLQLAHVGYAGTPLRRLTGMSHNHEVRLGREGFDNIENLANASWLDLYLRTGFTYKQLKSWIGQAWLMHHFGEDDYRTFANATGIVDAEDLRQFLKRQQAQGSGALQWSRIFAAPETAHLAAKTEIVCGLLPGWSEGHKVEIPGDRGAAD